MRPGFTARRVPLEVPAAPPLAQLLSGAAPAGRLGRLRLLPRSEGPPLGAAGCCRPPARPFYLDR